MTTDVETSPKELSIKQEDGNVDDGKRLKHKRRHGSKERSPSSRKRRRSRDRNRSRSRSPRDYDRGDRYYNRKRHYQHRQRYKDLDRPDEYERYYGDSYGIKNEDDDDNDNRGRRHREKVGTRYYDEYNKDDKQKEANAIQNEKETKKKKSMDMITSKTGGAYIPPAKLRLMQAEITDKTSAAYQRIAWEALKKSIHGHINKVNTSNIGIIARELLHENIVRGRGLLCKSLIQAQAASPTFTNVYAALVAVINSKFPNIGELLLKRLVLQFKRGYKQNNKTICLSAVAFIAHLVNQRVAHEILALEILTLLVESPTDDSVEVSISFLKECGQKLTEVSSKGINAIFEMLRNILHEGQLEKRIQYMIEVMFQVRKDGFKDHAAIVEELDVVEEEDQFTHLITLDDVKAVNSEDTLNVFRFDDNYEENEDKYKTLSKEILGSDDEESGSGSEGSDEDEEDDEDADGDGAAKESNTIIDNTETNLITLRRTIYLTIQSSLDFEECAHKLMKMELKPGQEIELCHMFLDCCAEQRTYEKFYGLLAQRFCQINNIYVEPFQQIFKDTYATTHRLDANRLRNVSKFFAHLLFTDAISWEVLEAIQLNENDTNSSSRIFIKILFQELAEYMGLGKLNARLKDETLQGSFAGLFPRDNPKNTRFSINFFTSIGLGGLTDELRDHLKSVPKNPTIAMNLNKSESGANSNSSSSSSDSSSSSSSSDSSSSDSESSSSSSSSNDDDAKKRKKKVKSKKEATRNKIDDDEKKVKIKSSRERVGNDRKVEKARTRKGSNERRSRKEETKSRSRRSASAAREEQRKRKQKR